MILRRLLMRFYGVGGKANGVAPTRERIRERARQREEAAKRTRERAREARIAAYEQAGLSFFGGDSPKREER